ncbi:MAG: YihA family ribosome biogenesis GTP-binding protein [Bacteroidetes bacterium]|nr:YihA family ribosome biogenesis GTP-binding protein [Bacteroidota bacterium]
MIFKTANYTGSFPDYKKCPEKDMPEFAFIGRSNVGKSSLINMLTNHQHLAKTSARPGKTQTINFFLINDTWNLVDLPGYGFAKVSKAQREQFEGMIADYLKFRPQMRCVFQLVDSCIPPQKIDLEFTDWLGEERIPFCIAFTKSDRRKKDIKGNIEAYKQKLSESWETLPEMFVTSAETRVGRDEVLAYLDKVLLD